MKYFRNCRTLNELKAEFRRLAKINHPDAGGDTEVMKQINIEYDILFPRLKAAYNATAKTPTTETADSTRRDFYTANGWAGSRYDSSRSLKEIAQLVRAYVKEFYPTYKFSVRTAYASMCQELRVDLKESPIEIYKTAAELNDEDKHEFFRKANRNDVWTLSSWTDAEFRAEYDRITSGEYGYYYKIINEATKAVVDAVDGFVQSYNYNDCDGMIDYFDVNFYYFGCCENNGVNVKIVPRTPRLPKEPKKAGKSADEDTAAPVRVQINPEFNGIEVYFSSKPNDETRAAMKADGWRWHGKKQCWYNKNTEKHLLTLREILEPTKELQKNSAERATA